MNSYDMIGLQQHAKGAIENIRRIFQMPSSLVKLYLCSQFKQEKGNGTFLFFGVLEYISCLSYINLLIA